MEIGDFIVASTDVIFIVLSFVRLQSLKEIRILHVKQIHNELALIHQ